MSRILKTRPQPTMPKVIVSKDDNNLTNAEIIKTMLGRIGGRFLPESSLIHGTGGEPSYVTGIIGKEGGVG